ncbi:MAG: oxygenase MpaB family protein, partial [Pararhizobium sp.]
MFDGFRPILLPQPILRQVDGFAEAFLRPPAGREIDFSEPRGEPALAAPESLSWIIFKNPISLFIGGVAGVLLELAEPQVRDGVWQHTSFRSDPLQRLKRTGLAAMITVYGPRSTAEAMIAGVRRLH